jgi:hypothetical protein
MHYKPGILVMTTKANFYLINYELEHSISAQLFEYKISLKRHDSNYSNNQLHNSLIEEFRETGILEIIGPYNEDLFLQTAIDITNLLSLALGKTFPFDNQEYFNEGRSKKKTKEMVRPMNSGNQIVPEFGLGKYLEETFPIWQNLPKNEKDRYFVVINYLNQSKHGYIEDRILRAAQAWEILAEFQKIESDLSDGKKSLRTSIKRTIKEWKKQFPDEDEDGVLCGKILLSIDREKNLQKLIMLAERYKLLIDKIGIDFRQLKELRDQAVHSGIININGREAIKVLEPAVKGLQLVLLKIFNYDGLVLDEEKGFVKHTSMSEFFG